MQQKQSDGRLEIGWSEWVGVTCTNNIKADCWGNPATRTTRASSRLKSGVGYLPHPLMVLKPICVGSQRVIVCDLDAPPSARHEIKTQYVDLWRHR